MSNNGSTILQDEMSRLEDGTISALYNSFLFNILLLGIYTIVYFSAIYIYLTSRMSRNLVVLAALTALYLINVEQAAIQWFWIDKFIGMVGQSKNTAYIYANTGPSWSYLVTNVNAFLLATISDSLLIWRCYNVWNKSLRVILLPSVLLLMEIATGIANVVKIATDQFNPNTYSTGTSLQIQTTLALFSAFALTLVTTSLILYRIITLSRDNGMSRRTKITTKAIVDSIVQSSAVYSLLLLVYAISWSITPATTLQGQVRQIPLNYLTNFIEEISFIAAGMAPTVMVARIARLSSKKLNSSEVTDQTTDLQLEFRAATRNATTSTLTALESGQEREKPMIATLMFTDSDIGACIH